MAKQLQLLNKGQIIPTALHTEMERSYLEYAMSVIVGRALPDVRDGLKPVHRRILYAMYELGLTPDRPYRKCARVVGDVLGKYHPHGDQSVYDALVRMVQDFSSRYPLLSGHGNFGSVDNDPPAAMRYTETRLASVAYDGMLQQIGEATVNFSSNFDNSQQEPTVLPTQLPILLLNGCSGIAVGMATNIPPHNLGEVVDGLIALIDNPDLPDEKLFNLIPGPDFPTGGEIVDNSGSREAYLTGRGLIPVRGIVHLEKLEIGKKRKKIINALVVTELPYQVNKAAWIEKIADLVNQGRLEEIADIRDESDRTGMRVVIELKKEAKAQQILEKLYRQTALQSNFGAIMLALVKNKPCQLSLRELLEEFLKFREETLTRQYDYELKECEKRSHLVEGLLTALNNLDQLIEILRHASDGSSAKARLQVELGISDEQSDSILAMPMRRITGLEKQKLQKEYEDLQARINELNILLSDRHELMKFLKKELRSLKRKFGDERRTRIITPQNKDKSSQKTPRDKASPEQSSKEIKADQQTQKETKKTTEETTPKKVKNISKNNENKLGDTQPLLTLFTPQKPPENALIEITNENHIYWTTSNDNNQEISFINQGKSLIVKQLPVNQQEQLVIIADHGKAYPLQIQEIPPIIQQPPQTILGLLPPTAQRDGNYAIESFFLPEDLTNLDLLLLTQQGKIKRIKVEELLDLTNRGSSLIKLKDHDHLQFLAFTQEGKQIAIATSGGRILRFDVRDEIIPLMGKSAQGNQALKLRFGERIINCLSLEEDDNLLLVSQSGYGKRIPLSEIRFCRLGEIGTHALQFNQKNEQLAGMIQAKSGQKASVLTDHQRQLEINLDQIRFWGKDGTGDQVIKLNNQENIIFLNLNL
jgi:DNA gyrase subunit A